jgi:hypothetical protein
MIDSDDYGAIGGMDGKENQSTGRKLAPVQLCPPQVPYELSPGSNLGLCRWKSVTNCLTNSTANQLTNQPTNQPNNN